MLCQVESIPREDLGVMRIQLIKYIQDESTVGVKENELEYQADHFARWVFNNDD